MSAHYSAAYTFAIAQLTKLPAQLCYHNIAHTRDDVLPGAMRLAELCGVDSADLLLLKTAAVFHDIGFIEQASGHEAISARVAGEVLPQWGYSADQIAQIQQIIRATALPQSPQTQLAKILCDADLDVLGRDDFLTRNLLLYTELYLTTGEISLLDWFDEQQHFLAAHIYHTAAARTLRDVGKRQNLALLDQLRRSYIK